MAARHNNKRQRIMFLLPLASGVMWGAAFLYADLLWWLGAVALVPLLRFISSVKTARAAFVGSWVAGFVGFGLSFSWYWNSLPLDWIGVPTMARAVTYVGISWGLTTLVLSLAIAVWGVVARHFLRVAPIWVALIALPALWAACEYARAWMYAFLTYGVGVALGPHFTVGFLGYLLAHHPILLQCASIGGVYWLSAAVVLFNTALFLAIRREGVSVLYRTLFTLLFLGVLIVSSFISIPASDTVQKGTRITIALLNTDFSPTLRISASQWQTRDTAYRALFSHAAHLSPAPDIIIFPEDTRFLSSLFQNGTVGSYMEDVLSSSSPLIIDSGRIADSSGDTRERLLFYDFASRTLATRDKVFLAPQGEYVPALFSFIVSLFGDSTADIEKSRTYHPGTGMDGKTMGEMDTVSIGGLFCSEMFSPPLFRSFRKQGAELYAVSASHGWFHHSRLLYEEFRAAAQVRAVENRLPLVVAANGFPAFAVDPWGRVTDESEWGTQGILTVITTVR